MKTAKTLVAAIFICFGFVLISCHKEETSEVSSQNPQQENVTTIKIKLDVSNIIKQAQRSSTANTTKDLFDIYAFRQNENGDFIYEKTINLENLTYFEEVFNLTGTDNVPVGYYKFLTTYGLQQNCISIPSWSNEVLSDNLSINYETSSSLSEVFLENSNVNELKTYDFFTDNNDNVVQTTLKRTLSRVDVIFIRADRNDDGTYTEVAYTNGSDVFGGNDINIFQMNFSKVNTSMNFLGRNLTTEAASLSTNLENLEKNIIIGNGNQTIVGTEDYKKYDDIEQQDILTRSAYTYGAYLFPNNNSDPSIKLSLYLKSENGDERAIDILNGEDNLLPVERNKVTLVKIYVLGKSIFSTTTDIAISVDIEDITIEDEGDADLWN
ncbi:MAG: hypothetical protein LBG19_06490 [Prevotellaceae bacterium]|jgi:hypothetical protein|nr:hypothetical protein [Prevotellaceae bacterium]